MQSELSPFQKQIAASFLEADTEKLFVLTGGAALIVHGLSRRATQDLDFFTSHSHEAVKLGLNNLINLASVNGWNVELISDEDDFKRVVVHGPEALLVDIARDSLWVLPPVTSVYGQVLSPAELAARKLLAVFDRAEARDFVDMYQLVNVFTLDEMFALAQSIDPGLEVVVLLEMLGSSKKYDDKDFEDLGFDAHEIRDFIKVWELSLQSKSQTETR